MSTMHLLQKLRWLWLKSYGELWRYLCFFVDFKSWHKKRSFVAASSYIEGCAHRAGLRFKLKERRHVSRLARQCIHFIDGRQTKIFRLLLYYLTSIMFPSAFFLIFSFSPIRGQKDVDILHARCISKLWHVECLSNGLRSTRHSVAKEKLWSLCLHFATWWRAVLHRELG